MVLALLYLGLNEGARAWKSFDWDAMTRLHAQGYISDPVSQAKSVPTFGLRALTHPVRQWHVTAARKSTVVLPSAKSLPAAARSSLLPRLFHIAPQRRRDP